MKKLGFLPILLVVLALLGCQQGQAGDAWPLQLSKAQQIAVLPQGSDSPIKVLTGQEALEDFVLALDLEAWKPAVLPAGLEPLGAFLLSQEDTVKLGEQRTDAVLYPLGRILYYAAQPYVTIEIDHWSICFQISQAAADYLGQFFA